MKYFLGVVCGGAGSLLLYVTLLCLSLGRAESTDAIQIGLWYEHKDRALEAAPSPRLIVVGGSSGLYGIDAGLLGEITGWPTVNYATHAALPLDYHLERALRVARSGDAILLNLEYGMLSRQVPNVVSTHFVLEQDPGYLTRQPLDRLANWVFSAEPAAAFRRLDNLLLGEPTVVIDDLRKNTERDLDAFGSHRMNHLAEQTDYHRGLLDGAAPVRAWLFPTFFSDVLEQTRPRIESFSAAARKKGVHLFAAFPPVMEDPEYAEREKAIESSSEMWAEFYRQMGIVPVGQLEESILPRSKFFDSIKHLHASGMKEYTEELGLKLKKVLPERTPPAN